MIIGKETSHAGDVVAVVIVDGVGFPQHDGVEHPHENEGVGGFCHGWDVCQFGFDEVDVVPVKQ